MFQLHGPELPEQLRRLSADVGSRTLCIVVRLRDHAVVGQFPVDSPSAMVDTVSDWLAFVARAAGVAAGPALSGWIADAAQRIVDHVGTARAVDG